MGLRSSEIICEAMKRRYSAGRIVAKEGRGGNEAGRGRGEVALTNVARAPLEERRKVAEMLFRRLRASSFIAWEIALGR